MNDLNLSDLSAAQRQRLAFIEFRLWFYGAVARKEVLERFEVATAAGTRDMALYKELAPGNVRYERKQYAYQAGFRPLFHHAVDQVLAALTTGWGAGGAVAGGDPISHAVPARLNQPSLDILATVTRAIAGGDALQLVYHSMKTGPGLREIVPHSLVDSGLRWHVRAFDRTKGHFRDLVLTRMEQVQPAASAVPIAAQELVAADVQPYMRHGTVLDNQKALTVRSAFLQNREYMDVFYREGYTVMEMEGGPYLSAIYEIAEPKRHPKDELVMLSEINRFELGVIHYASDTPYSRRQSLLSKSLSFFGVESTYDCAIAIARRIFAREIAIANGVR